MLFGSLISVVVFGFSSHIIALLFARFFAGTFSNSQQYIRKFLQVTATKSEWPSLSEKCLFAHKFGTILGVLIAVLTTTPSYFFGPASIFTKYHFLLFSCTVLLLQITGVMLVFSTEFQENLAGKAEKYVELPEIKIEVKAQPEEKNEKYGFERYIRSNREEEVIEEPEPDELRFYSPRTIVNKVQASRRLKSTLPKIEMILNEAELEKNDQSGDDFKRTHISFIDEEDEEKTVEIQKETLETTVRETSEVIASTVGFACRYRVLLTFTLTLVMEIVPFWIFLREPERSVYELGIPLLVVFSLAMILHLVTFKSVLKKISYREVIQICLAVLLVTSIVLPIFSMFSFTLLGIFLVVFVSIYTSELVLPLGVVLISDSTNLESREKIIEKNNLFCLIVKAFASFTGPALLSILPTTGIPFWISAFGFFFLLLHSLKLKKYYPCLCTVPYKE